MCGIAGFIDPGQGSELDLDAMIRALGHRGPDARETLAVGRVGLAAARLELVGASAGAQPRRSDRGSLFAMNGEIYNWRDLGEEESSADSDTAALHDLLDREGLEILHQVRGGYALAWAPGRDRLVLARDPFGQRPLYWARVGEALVFGSEIRALIAAGLRPALDEDALATLLRFQFLPPGRSLFAGVRSLCPGEILDLRLKAGRISFRRQQVELEDLAYGLGEEELAETLRDAAWLQRAGSARAGILLSGGLDSSATLALLAREGGVPDRAYVGWFPEGPERFDERPFARIAAAAARVPLEEVAIDARSFAAAMPRSLAALEEPLAGPGAVSQFILCERAASDVRVLFAGQGGDELFGGYERLRILARLEASGEAEADDSYRPLLERMRAAHAAAPEDALAAYRAAVDRGAALEACGNDRARDLLKRAPRIEALVPDATGPATSIAAAFEWRVLLPGLLQVDDRCGAAFGLEGRSIFLDQALAAELLTMPPRRKCSADDPRALFRRLLDGLLPAEIVGRREKLGFPVPLRSWWRGPLRDFAGDLLSSNAASPRALIATEALDPLLEDDGQGGRLVYFLLMLELWHRRFADGLSGRPMTAEDSR